MLARLKEDDGLAAHARAMEGVADMELLFGFVAALGVPEDVLVFDLSLARGLDYYTGSSALLLSVASSTARVVQA